MKRMMTRAFLLATGAALFLLPALSAQTPNFSKYVALGDSYGAGFGAGCLVARHQAFSGPNILAKQLGFTDFQQPTISDPGIPTCNGLKTLVPSVTFGPISTKTGAPTNALLSRAYDNLSVPGFKIADVSDTFGGPWREGVVNVALGVAGVQPLVDYRGTVDSFGRSLKSTVIAVADELASAAEIVTRKAAGTPVAIVRGAAEWIAHGTGRALVRDAQRDLFR